MLQLPEILYGLANGWVQWEIELSWSLAKLSDVLEVIRENLRKHVTNENIARDVFKLPSSLLLQLYSRSNAQI